MWGKMDERDAERNAWREYAQTCEAALRAVVDDGETRIGRSEPYTYQPPKEP